MSNKKYDVCIIGGGITGTALGYFLCKLGKTSVAIFEKSYLSSGSTGRCAGGIRQQWSTRPNVRLAMRSVKLFERFKEDVGMDIEYTQGGYLVLSYTENEAAQFERNVLMQREEGLNVEILSPSEVSKRYPYINIEGLKLATFCQTDGHANPHKAVIGYAQAIRKMGGAIFTHTEVTDIDVINDRVVGINTSRGYFSCDVVVNASGPWSREISELVGVELPTESYRHQIMVTEPLENFFPMMAISFSGNFYMRQTQHGQFILGQGDKDEKPGINYNVTFKFEKELTSKMIRIFPFLKNVRLIRHWSGMYNMSPDAQPIIGESEKVKGYYYAVGYSGHGFMVAPAVGEALAELLVFGKTLHTDISYLGLKRFENMVVEKEKNVV
ncbi:MAG: FAD-binding oxidoreductase [Fervidobacterium sp.]|uniref:Sarcosine oxidase subunit beta n=1 Tax=Fervidobacterium gondwanense DSM 13020 TaxID=1121883 RepID=A0A1M7S7G3_FERGO|nr:FAD-binding oxidoreductase [Fervidobacterium gondwanense]SHN54567.1 sarcosine oxidase subunit beta [Fervidobacterium gondwanense DSM 13020]